MSSSFLGEDLVKEWSLSFADIDFVNAKAAAARLGFSAQLKFFAARGVFAETSTRSGGRSRIVSGRATRRRRRGSFTV
jgi:hypothetical protein